MEFDVVLYAVIKHQGTNAFPRLPTTGEDCNPNDDELLFMSVSSPPREKRKAFIKLRNIIENCDDTDATATSPGLLTVCPITTPKAETTTPTLTELVIEQANNAFCRQKVGTMGTPSLCYSYDRKSPLVCTASLDGTIKSMIPSALLPSLLYLAHYPKLARRPGERCMYDTMVHELYWPHMSNSVYRQLVTALNAL